MPEAPKKECIDWPSVTVVNANKSSGISDILLLIFSVFYFVILDPVNT